MRESVRLYIISAIFFAASTVTASLAVSYVACPNHWTTIAALCSDSHYKYLVPLLIPVTSYFVIANWVGWQFFRYA